MSEVLPLLLLVLAFGLLFILPMRQRRKIADRQAAMQAQLSVGTPIMLSCGLYGRVAGLDTDTVDVEIAPGTVARFARATVLELTTPRPPDSDGPAGNGPSAVGGPTG